MGNAVCYLITLLTENGRSLYRIALKLNREELSGDIVSHYAEIENRAIIYSFLPEHIRELGPIVDIEEIFEIW